MTLAQLNEMDMDEYLQWQLFYSIRPFPVELIEETIARGCANIACSCSSKAPRSISSYKMPMLDYGAKKGDIVTINGTMVRL